MGYNRRYTPGGVTTAGLAWPSEPEAMVRGLATAGPEFVRELATAPPETELAGYSKRYEVRKPTPPKMDSFIHFSEGNWYRCWKQEGTEPSWGEDGFQGPMEEITLKDMTDAEVKEANNCLVEYLAGKDEDMEYTKKSLQEHRKEGNASMVEFYEECVERRNIEIAATQAIKAETEAEEKRRSAPEPITPSAPEPAPGYNLRYRRPGPGESGSSAPPPVGPPEAGGLPEVWTKLHSVQADIADLEKQAKTISGATESARVAAADAASKSAQAGLTAEAAAAQSALTAFLQQKGWCRFYNADRDQFPEGSDAWNALGISPNMEVTIDENGIILDIWDNVTKITYDVLGNVTGTRVGPYTG